MSDNDTVICDLMAALEKQKKMIGELTAELDRVFDMVDDILYDPTFKPRTQTGKPITGDDVYLLEHKVQYEHMPSLRAWFVERSRAMREPDQPSPEWDKPENELYGGIGVPFRQDSAESDQP